MDGLWKEAEEKSVFVRFYLYVVEESQYDEQQEQEQEDYSLMIDERLHEDEVSQ